MRRSPISAGLAKCSERLCSAKSFAPRQLQRFATVDPWGSNCACSRVIDARGRVVCPGLIDLSARLREPGFEYKATLESEMEAAVAGGVTTGAGATTPAARSPA